MQLAVEELHAGDGGYTSCQEGVLLIGRETEDKLEDQRTDGPNSSKS